MFTIRMWSVQGKQMAKLSSKCPRGWWLMSSFGERSWGWGGLSVHSYSERVDAPWVCLDISLEEKERHVRGIPRLSLMFSILSQRDGQFCTMRF